MVTIQNRPKSVIMKVLNNYDVCTKEWSSMEFSSLSFIFRFLPVFLIIYYLVPVQFRNPVLLLASIVFYGCGDLRYIPLILVSMAGNYILVRRMDAYEKEMRNRTWMMAFLVCVNVVILLLFKYTDYPMPLGMSFYTFTVLSYVLDVYFGRAKAETSLIDAGVYMVMFPKMISGPIAGYADMQGEIKKRRTTLRDIEEGLVLFIIGLGFKVILAEHFGMLWHDIRSAGFDSISTPLAWIGIVGYSAQLFFDFQGYSLMAVGAGRMIGFHLPWNFNHPYRAKTVAEYYRRWHMTLGQWFKNYLYIPLGGNRGGMKRTILNLFVVWLVTGIWHGATVNYITWGLALFVLIVGERLLWGKKLQESQVIGRIYICGLIPLTWLVFAVDNLKEIGVYFTRLFPFWGSADYVNHMDFVQKLQNYTPFFVMAFLVSLPFADKIYEKYHNTLIFKAVTFVVFAVCVYEMANGLNNPFLYFRF